MKIKILTIFAILGTFTCYADIPQSFDSLSNAEQMEVASKESESIKVKCDELIRRYRLKLKDDPETLKDLNSFIQKSEEIIALQIKLIGGSWGGSGARVAYAESRMEAYSSYFQNLESLSQSLHLQDLPK